MNEQKGRFKNLYKHLITPVLKKDSGIDAEYLTNLSLVFYHSVQENIIGL